MEQKINPAPFFPTPRIVNSGDIDLAVHEMGEGPPVILIHGFPELAYSWRHQLPAFAEAGYRAIAPDMRGYGGSDKPPHVDDYTIQKLIGDIEGLMAALSIDKAVVIGHDWGAMLTWQMALLAPQRMAGLITLNIPHIPRPPTLRHRSQPEVWCNRARQSAQSDRERGWIQACSRTCIHGATRLRFDFAPPRAKRCNGGLDQQCIVR